MWCSWEFFNFSSNQDFTLRYVPCKSFTEIWNGIYQLTAEVEQVCEEEGLLVEVLYGHNYGSIQTAAESLLRAALIGYK